jgi:hypothetical protein
LQTGLDWKRAPRPQFRDFFGFGEDRADYQPKSDARMIIEFKVLRERREYDFKNGLAQLLVQAIALPAERAILLVIDRGRACGRPWKKEEKRFLKAFLRNSIGIELGVVRVTLLVREQKVGCEIFV